jgi:translation elongation factor P
MQLFTFLLVLFYPGMSQAFVRPSMMNRVVRGNTANFLSTADFKNGMTFEIDGAPFKLIEFLHVKPGKGSAFVRSKIKNMENGSVQEKTFRAGESITAAQVEKVEMQFTYDDGNNLCFMNMETFEEQMIENKKIDNVKLLTAGLAVNVLLWNEKVIDVQLPQMMDCKVIECPPNFKGNTAQGATKPATLEGGAEVNVPMFIESGEIIRIDTSEMKYVSRADK